MQIYDLIMLAVLAGSIIYGARKGMAWQIASIGSLVVSYFVALQFSEPLSKQFKLDPPLNRMAAMLALYLGTSLVVWLLFRQVSNGIERMKLKEFDRQVGGLFGAAKGVLYCVIITFFAVFISRDARDTILRSHSGHYIAILLDKVDPLLPTEVRQRIGPYLDRLDRELEPAMARDAGDDWLDEEPVDNRAEDERWADRGELPSAEERHRERYGERYTDEEPVEPRRPRIERPSTGRDDRRSDDRYSDERSRDPRSRNDRYSDDQYEEEPPGGARRDDRRRRNDPASSRSRGSEAYDDEEGAEEEGGGLFDRALDGLQRRLKDAAKEAITEEIDDRAERAGLRPPARRPTRD